MIKNIKKKRNRFNEIRDHRKLYYINIDIILYNGTNIE